MAEIVLPYMPRALQAEIHDNLKLRPPACKPQLSTCVAAEKLGANGHDPETETVRARISA